MVSREKKEVASGYVYSAHKTAGKMYIEKHEIQADISIA